jgi:hypothetical protein
MESESDRDDCNMHSDNKTPNAEVDDDPVSLEEVELDLGEEKNGQVLDMYYTDKNLE